ncbi:hypothetical protein MKK63_11170 [Methylobacterium sp. J-088]|uniref:hypothetical protein n=1 Tax=Methylobacterium sp. J-088 TaxID=2836664 RepID=UPI001FB9BA85|nr:hypothetical protein [Methylobacterium sp. J-088]MCJ2063271.1 hypothetical protein [Methylobacterium sp. J-088]
MTLRTSLQRLIGRDPTRLTLRERAAETAARLAASRPAADAATADPPTLADAALTVAAAELQRVEATIAAIPTAPGQDLDDVPGYGILDAAADRAADVLTNTPADSLIGLQAKAAAILSDRFSVQSPEALEMAQSLARDVLGAPPASILASQDPILPAIKECRRLVAVVEAAEALPQPEGRLDALPEQQEAFDVLNRYIEDVLLKTVPTTAHGCAALAQYAVEFSAARGFELDDGEDGAAHLRVLDLIASSPLFDAGAQGGREPRPLPRPDSPEALTRYEAACREDTRRSRLIVEGYPELKRTSLEWWTQDTLWKAWEAGDIGPAECARLLHMASERELRLAQVEHDLDLGPLQALASAGAHGTLPRGEAIESEAVEPDPAFGLIESHQAAYAEYDRLGSGPGVEEMQQSSVALARAEDLAFMRLLGGLPTSLPGLMALADYLPKAIRQRGGDDAEDEAVIALGGICASIRALVAEGKVAAAPGAEPTDWYSPPPGFMASPAIEPTHFALIPHALRVELDRLHCIAQREFDRQVRPDTAPERRERLRRLLKIDIFEAASLSGDAEILALGMELDAVHTRWRQAEPAYKDAQARFSRAERDAKARGKDIWAASEAVWAEPGVREAISQFEGVGAELDPICHKIWHTPARTPLGLAVKARASLVMAFTCGEYEAGQTLGDGEDLPYKPARYLIEACCAFAGVNWKGELLDGSTPSKANPGNPPRTTYGIAERVDFAQATLDELRVLHDKARALSDVAYSMSCQGACQSGDRSLFGDHHNRAGHLLHWLGDALTDVESAAADEMQRRQPASQDDRRERLASIAERIILNGDTDETAFFIGQLTACLADQVRR